MYMKNAILKITGENGVTMGVAPVERLTSPPSADPRYLMPDCHSVIALLHPLDTDAIQAYLGKKDQSTFQEHEKNINIKVIQTADLIVEHLKKNGFKAINAPINFTYRYHDKKPLRIPYQVIKPFLEWLTSPSGKISSKIKKYMVGKIMPGMMRNVDWKLTPTFSLRYAAVAAGIGSLGWSGNVLAPQYGARVVLGAVITNAVIEADPMLEENLCDGCRICVKVCQSGFISAIEKDQVSIGGKVFHHNKKKHNIRCTFVCGGLSGQSKYKEWATWSPARVELPNEEEQLVNFFNEYLQKNLWQHNWASKQLKLLFLLSVIGMKKGYPETGATTCQNCRIVCWKNKAERLENYRILQCSKI
jgi:epoxyqueuosine reductase